MYSVENVLVGVWEMKLIRNSYCTGFRNGFGKKERYWAFQILFTILTGEFSTLLMHSTQKLTEHGIQISMSRSGNPYDNAFAESFNKTVKVEEVYINEYETFEDAYKNIKQFIELVYNKKRLHSSLGYVPPEEFEREVLKTRAA